MVDFREAVQPPDEDSDPRLNQEILDLMAELFRQKVRVTYFAWNHILFRLGVLERHTHSYYWVRLKDQLPKAHRCLVCRTDGTYTKRDRVSEWFDFAPSDFFEWPIIPENGIYRPVAIWYSRRLDEIDARTSSQ